MQAKDLAKFLSPLLPLWSNNPTWPILSTVHLYPGEDGQMRARATDLETVVELHVPIVLDWEAAVPGKFFVNLLKEIGDYEARMAPVGAKAPKLAIVYQFPGVDRPSRATINCVDHHDFPALNDAEWSVLAAISGAHLVQLKREIAFAADAKSEKSFRYVGFDGEKVYASDAKKLALGITDDSKSTMLVAASALRLAGDLFAGDDQVSILIDQERTELRMVGQDRWLQTTLGVIKYPDLNALRANDFDGSLRTSHEDLLRMVKICQSYRSDVLHLRFGGTNECLFSVNQSGDTARNVLRADALRGVLSASTSLGSFRETVLALGRPANPIVIAWVIDKKLLYLFESNSRNCYVLPMSPA